MKCYSVTLVFCLFTITSFSQPLQQIEKGRVKLPNGWSLTPVGKSLPLGDLPLNMVVSRSGKYVAVTNNGQSVQSIQLFDVARQKQLDSKIIPKSWYGLSFSGDEKFLYASGGNDNRILQYDVSNSKLRLSDSIILGKPWPEKISPAGLVVDNQHNMLYVVTKNNKSLYVVDLSTKKISQQYTLPDEAYTCLLSPTKHKLFITCWGCDKLLVFDTESKTFKQPIALGDNPNEMVLSKNERYLYVCNGNENTVSVIDLTKNAVIETLNTALYADALNGSTPNGLALSADEKTIYIANATNNCLAVFDVSKPGLSKARGFIPVGWYPTNVKVIGKNIWVANGKGFTSMANPRGPNPVAPAQVVGHHVGDSTKPATVQYIAGLFKGTLSIINEPDDKQLMVYSKAVYNNTLYTKKKEMTAEGTANNPIPMTKGQKSPIKYVFYVIKENRTYDQVLGDIPEGNGDPSLVLFGEKVTPNLHVIARDFVLLDNVYADAEVSADGHNWTMGAYANDFVEKTWPTSYGGRGGAYPGEGKDPLGNNKGGFIWNACKRSGVSYRSYGEFADNGKANIDELKGHVCPGFAGFNLSIPDTTRFTQWKHDFDSLIAINAVPRFNSLRLGTDHTEGLRKGRPTPYAHVADNDYAIGMLVDYLSKSPIWNETAIFMIEDDAQNGADHVDAHRTTAYVAGGLVRRHFVDHTAYSTTSLLRTMELILGVPPMTQYDAAAVPMWRSFNNVAKPSPFVLQKPNIDLNERNVAVNKWQQKSEKFDLSKEDAAPDLEFNEVLWHAVKGEHIPFPGAKRSAFVQIVGEKDADD
ncbi:MAG: bifunctional YncE family protein/alkaline phosphatase family protein [Bacteroidota bacterium]|nr:bifunctional YncE family protein/alkaline phosphatase family protein [Bacteroidota bacterium]